MFKLLLWCRLLYNVEICSVSGVEGGKGHSLSTVSSALHRLLGTVQEQRFLIDPQNLLNAKLLLRFRILCL